jgi:minor curlin subunit
MRKFLMIGASVFALGAGSAWAAPEITLDDSGENNSSQIMQSADDSESSINVIQSQDGDGALDIGSAIGGLNVYIDQTVTDDSTIHVEQHDTGDLGGGTSASVMQYVSKASDLSVMQDGSENRALVDQMGEEQMATVEQTGEGNTAELWQEAEANTGTIIQMGEDNTATVGQYGEGSIAMTTQDGEENIAMVEQYSMEAGATVTVMQTGDTGNVHIVQN